MSLVSASDISTDELKFELPESVADYIQVISELESGCITLIQSDNLKRLHQFIHEIMIHAVIRGIDIKLVDSSNCFNPHMITKMVYELPGMPISPQTVLQNIQLSRPFQVLQAVSIVNSLEKLMQGRNNELVILTDISKHFFDPQVAQQDPDYPKGSIDSLRIAVNKIKSLTMANNLVLITDRIDRDEIEDRMKYRLLSSAAKIRITVKETENKIISKLENHPYRPPLTKIREILPKITLGPGQKELNSFFTDREDDAEIHQMDKNLLLATGSSKSREKTLDQFF